MLLCCNCVKGKNVNKGYLIVFILQSAGDMCLPVIGDFTTVRLNTV